MIMRIFYVLTLCFISITASAKGFTAICLIDSSAKDSAQIKVSTDKTQSGRGSLKDEQGTILSNEGIIWLGMHTSGFHAGYRRTYIDNVFKKRSWEVELSTIKHPKEYSINSIQTNGETFVFGKLNSVWFLRGSYGIDRIIVSKYDKAGVEIFYHLQGGLTLAFAKPIYYQIVVDFNNQIFVEEKFNADKHFPQIIAGKAPFTLGFDELRIYPGLFSRASCSFEYGGNSYGLKIIEVGVSFEAFLKPIPIMALTSNPQFYSIAFINLAWGKKW